MVGRPVRMCPWRAFADPFVSHVLRAWSWAEKGELATRYGGDPPEALLRGVEVFRSALAKVRAHDDAEDRERAEQERARNAKAPTALPPARPSARRGRP